MQKTRELLGIRHEPFEMPDIQLNSQIFNPNKRKSKRDEINVLKDMRYQYFDKYNEERKAYKAQRQFTSKDTQIKYSQNRDSATFLMLLKKTEVTDKRPHSEYNNAAQTKL